MKALAIVPVVLRDETSKALLLDRVVVGRSVLGHVLDRLARVERLAGIVVATTSAVEDDAVEDFCRSSGNTCFRGGPDGAENRLGLVLAALRSVGGKAGILVRPDCPLIDPALVDQVASLVEMTDGMVDFIGTTLAAGCPRGMEVEAFTLAALDDADRRCAEAATRRDATLYLRQNSRLYRLLEVTVDTPLARPEVALAVTSEEDLGFVAEILHHFEGRADCSTRDVLSFLAARG